MRYHFSLHRPAIPGNTASSQNNQEENTSQTCLLNREVSQIISSKFIDDEIMRLGCDAIVSVQHFACRSCKISFRQKGFKIITCKIRC